ncbi:AMP-dependent synthetase/ligase [Streptomyces beihaiensis]|uniref:AMP-dependent synthetase/ligase n=1 Tax=Streptomyces beihaiensis TaxID=2984495 RepID=A0ABT3U2W5_9ACTN|nr:AMP-dependent synthetase/ligase [Streptomyces beihaiensis]MCX3062952.1 AMP-dependent synthetase/ligase [Streptomyces beihaiensis]
MRELEVPRLARPLASGGLADSVFTAALEEPRRVQFEEAVAGSAAGSARRPVTAARFAADVAAVARGFLADGIRPGHRVVVMSRTRYEWTLVAYALWAVGAVVVPVYPTSSAEQVRWILRGTGAVGVVVEDDHTAMTVAAAYGARTDLTRLWQLDAGGIDTLVEAGAAVEEVHVHQLRAGVRPHDTAVICYTSGTTGRPKGCVITHHNLAAETDNLLAGWGELLAPPGERPSLLAFLPLAHCYGLMVVVSAVRGGVTVAHQPDLSPGALLPALAAFRPTFLFAVPYIFERILGSARAAAQSGGHSALFERAARTAVRYAAQAQRHAAGQGPGPGARLRLRHAVYDRLVYAKVREVFGGRMRSAVSGGSPLSRDLGLFFAGCGITVYDGYGLTETTAAVTAQPVGAVRHGTVGRPLPGNAVRIADDGEIQVRGDVVFAGYLDDPQANAAAVRDGWFATGDLGRFDPDGYLVITGRKKDIIITSGGKSVSPQVLEEELRAHPLISGCLVVGDNRPYVAALITLDPQALASWQILKGRPTTGPEAARDDDELRGHIQRAVSRANSRVSRAESIRAFRVLPREFATQQGLLTPSLKVRRSAVLRTYAKEIEELYASR